MKVLVTGGMGFIGSAVVRRCLADGHSVVNVDKVTYAASEETLATEAINPLYGWIQADICDAEIMNSVFKNARPDAVLHLAAETHVDRSIGEPAAFITTNIVGTYNLLEAAHAYWAGLLGAEKDEFRFLHVSTDEVYGSLGAEGLFTEKTAYTPNSPYAASKASADHLVRSWNRTYGLPAIITNCSNNFGPFQFPEKLIPVIIMKARNGEPIPIYGDGSNVREWLFVDDHAEALLQVVRNGKTGETYNVGSSDELTNLDVARRVCEELDDLEPRLDGASHADRITFVDDRPGHDFRYALDASKIANELGWQPRHSLDEALRETVRWYIENETWCTNIMDGNYRGERLGLAHGLAGEN